MKKLKLITLFYLAIFAVSVVAMMILSGVPFVIQKYQTSMSWLFAALALSISIALLSGFLTRRTALFNPLKEIFQNFLEDFGFFSLLWIALLSGFGEEALFRGLIQPYAGIVWTSLGFGILHIGPSWKFLPWTAFAIVMGFLLGLVLKLSDSILLVSLIHASVNFFNLLDLKFGILDFAFRKTPASQA